MISSLGLTGSTFCLLATHLDDYNVDVIIALLTSQFPKRLAILPPSPYRAYFQPPNSSRTKAPLEQQWNWKSVPRALHLWEFTHNYPDCRRDNARRRPRRGHIFSLLIHDKSSSLHIRHALLAKEAGCGQWISSSILSCRAAKFPRKFKWSFGR